MMNPIGKWRVAEMMQFNEEKLCMEWAKVEDILVKEDLDKDMRFLAQTVMQFDSDGTIFMMTPLPEGVSQEEVEAAVKEGQIRLKDGLMLMEEKHWKVENDKVYTDTEPEGEVMGEKVGPWGELKDLGDGLYEMMTFRIERVG